MSAAEIEVTRAQAACQRREHVRLQHEAHHARRAAELKQNNILARLASARAAEARCLEETRTLMVALAEAEAAEAVANAAPIGVPMAASSATVVQGVMVGEPTAGEDAGVEADADGMLV